MKMIPPSFFAPSMWTYVASWSLTTLLGTFPWIILLLFLVPVLGIRQYTIRDLEVGRRIQKRITNFTSSEGKNRPSGWSIGKWFILHIESRRYSDCPETVDIWMIATEASYDRLTQQPTIDTSSSVSESDSDDAGKTSSAVHQGKDRGKKEITIIHRTGSFYHVDFTRRSIIVSFRPRTQQLELIRLIEETFTAKNHCVAFVHGPPGSGKSIVGLLLANKLDATYCNNLRPWQPGDTLARVHSEANPSNENPLVVLFDEIDTALINIHSGITPHKNIPIPVADKQGWNTLLDEFSYGMYPWTIILMTSNRNPDFINGMDASYIRPGRVDLIHEMS
jgi:hypothetical protein